LTSKLLKVLYFWLLNLDFDFIANTELVLDVLGATVASEDTATDHDAHLGRQSFGFFHRVGRKDDGTLLVSL